MPNNPPLTYASVVTAYSYPGFDPQAWAPPITAPSTVVNPDTFWTWTGTVTKIVQGQIAAAIYQWITQNQGQ